MLHVQEQSLTTELKDSRSSLKMDMDMTRSSKLRYHNSPQFPFPTFSFCNIWRGTHETSCISDTIQRAHRLQCHRIDITEVNGKKNIFWLSDERLRQYVETHSIVQATGSYQPYMPEWHGTWHSHAYTHTLIGNRLTQVCVNETRLVIHRLIKESLTIYAYEW